MVEVNYYKIIWLYIFSLIRRNANMTKLSQSNK